MTETVAGTTVPPSATLDSSGVDLDDTASTADSGGALGRQGRRNALGDVLDESVTKTSPKSLIETLSKIKSIDLEEQDGGATSESSKQQQTANN